MYGVNESEGMVEVRFAILIHPLEVPHDAFLSLSLLKTTLQVSHIFSLKDASVSHKV